MSAETFQPSHGQQMLRCECGQKYIVRRLPSRDSNHYEDTFFDFFDSRQAFGGTCLVCKQELHTQLRKAIEEWEKEQWGVSEAKP